MAKWWKETAWPWLKENWWALILAPVALLVLILMVMHKFALRGQLETLDPTANADERAKEERDKRKKLLEEENQRLEAELAEVSTKYEGLQAEFEQRLVDEVQSLREDPQRLRELMLGVGPGRRE